MMHKLFATKAAPQYLPPASPTEGQMYSVPRLDGLYDYYQGPPGSTPPRNDDYPLPTFAHPNPIGVSSLSVGRRLHPQAKKVGTGEQAIGSVTAMPGATLPLSLGGKLSGVETAFLGATERQPLLVAGAALVAVITFFVVRKLRRP